MQNIAVIFGGKSVEHDISIITGFGSLKNMPFNYNIVPIYIDKDGKWWTGKALFDSKTYQNKAKLKQCYLSNYEPKLFVKSGIMHKCIILNCAILCVHGSIYEGGGLQGMLDIINLPYSSADICASAVCLDKVLTKMLCKSLNIKTAKYELAGKNYETKKLKFPVIVKPVHLGSSVGIKIANNQDELKDDLALAKNFDNEILVEECFSSFRELNIAIFKYKDEMIISSVEEILKSDAIYSFEQKYTNQTDTKRIVPAKLNLKQLNKIVNIATTCYDKIKLNGVVRFDMFMVNGEIYLNEINTIPGSLAFYLFREQGINFAKLLDMLVKDAMYRFTNKNKLDYNFSSNILSTLDTMENVSQK